VHRNLAKRFKRAGDSPWLLPYRLEEPTAMSIHIRPGQGNPMEEKKKSLDKQNQIMNKPSQSEASADERILNCHHHPGTKPG
jgi:hypothetical protein